MHHRRSHCQSWTGVISCLMAYVLAAQVSLALVLNASIPGSLAAAFGAICHVGISVDQTGVPPEAPVKPAAHCPLCVAPAFGLLTPPDGPTVTRPLTGDMVCHVISSVRADLIAIPRAHRARAPPALA